MQFLDPKHPMFKRAWVRWLTILFPAAWAVVEFATGSPGWAVVFGAMAAYAVYQFYFNRQD